MDYNQLKLALGHKSQELHDKTENIKNFIEGIRKRSLSV